MNPTVRARLRTAFAFDRVLCRLFAAWTCFAASVLLTRQEKFLTLSFVPAYSLLRVGLTMVLLFLVFSAVAFFIRGIHTDSLFLLLAATVCAVLWLILCKNQPSDFLICLAVSVVYALFVLYFLQQNRELLAAWHPGRRTVLICAALFALLTCTVIALITCLRYRTFSSPNYDFGLFCNMFYHMKKCGLPLSTSERDVLLSHFAVHISPVYYLLLPFYAVFPSPLTLQIGQAVALAAGIIPVLLLAKRFRLSAKATILCAALYCFYPALSAGTFYDLHENCFLPLFLLFTFWFFETGRYPLMYVGAALVLSVKEDAAFYLLIFALYLLLSRRNLLHGGILAAVSLGYFFLCRHLLDRYGLGMMVNRFDNLIPSSEEGLLGAIHTALVNPGYLLTQLFVSKEGGWEKIQYLLQLLLPLGFLPFCTKKPSRWLLLAPVLFNLLTMYVYQYQIGFQYHFGITAFLIYAMMGNLTELHSSVRQTLLSLAAVFCLCLWIFTVWTRAGIYLGRYHDGAETYRQMEEILDTLPEDASLCVSTFLLPHVADRDTVFEVAYHAPAADIDYVVLDLRYDQSEYTARYLALGYTVAEEHPGKILILKKGT